MYACAFSKNSFFLSERSSSGGPAPFISQTSTCVRNGTRLQSTNATGPNATENKKKNVGVAISKLMITKLVTLIVFTVMQRHSKPLKRNGTPLKRLRPSNPE